MESDLIKINDTIQRLLAQVTTLKIKLIIFLILSSFNKLSGQVWFKNNTANPVNVAVQFPTDNNWFARGWMNITPGATEILIGKVENRFYYYYAISDNKIWEGDDTYGWVANKSPFLIKSIDSYTGVKGYKKVGFKLIDVGKIGKDTIILDLRSDFMLAIDDYLKSTKLDPLEGLYTISDEVLIDKNNLLYKDENNKLDHWAKVAIVRDTINLTRNYVQYFIEGEGFKESDVTGEYLQTQQSPNLFISKQLVEGGKSIKNVMIEFIPDEYKLFTDFSYEANDAVYKVKRTYLKYYPKGK